LIQIVGDWKVLNNFRTDKDREWEKIRERLKNPIKLPNSVELHLIRHAESTINADKRVTGLQDIELTFYGEKQASYLGTKLLKQYDLAFVSGLQRAQKTLQIAIQSGDIKVEKIFIDSRLNERSLGVLEGQKYRWIPEYACGDLKYAPENGENYESVARRIFTFLIELSDYVIDNQIKHILISSHMGPLRILVGILKEEVEPASVLGFKFSNAQVVKIVWDSLSIPGFLKDI